MWGPEQQKSFLNMINSCTSSPVLSFADISKPFKRYTYASMEGLGAVLYQEHYGKDRVVSYAGRRLSKSEGSWAVTEKFADYLHCNKSTINVIGLRIIYLIFYNIYFGVFTVAGIHRFPIYLRVIDMLGRQLCTRDILLCF